jgi:hypothetical protein
MKSDYFPRLFGAMLCGLLGAGRCAPGLAAPGLSVELPRHAYWRGESIPVTVRNAGATADVEVFLDSMRVASSRIQGDAAPIMAPTAGVKAGQYTLKAVVRNAAGTAVAVDKVTVARRPGGDRLEIWLWSAGGDGSYYFDHGFTIAGGIHGVYWRDTSRVRALKTLDEDLARGVYATLVPCGGIVRSDFRGLSPQGDDTAYRGAGRNEERYYNPFAPGVEELRSRLNRSLFGALGDHPAVKVAFFNTERVDDLWLDNTNRAGVELTRRKLGFTRAECGPPKFVAAGVIADDDRGYRFQKYVYQEGNGLAYANRKTAEDVKRWRPDVWTLNDPYRQVALLDMFPGLDLIGTWTYTEHDPKLMLYIETMRAITRGTGQIPLQTITLLNYPGMLAPRSLTGSRTAASAGDKKADDSGWMLMGPDACKETSWIILSRAPKINGYYYSSACDPVKFNRPEEQFRVPQATSGAIRELAERVYRPYGPMITRLGVAPRTVAVLSSQAAWLYRRSPRTNGYPNDQIYGFYAVLAMAHLDGDVLLDEQVERGALAGYKLLVLPKCDAVTKTMYDEILKFVRRGGLVVANQYLGPEIPHVLKLPFDFTYRLKVNADAIESGMTYAQWDDHLNPKTAPLAKARGVTAEDDQKIMESYARQLTAALGGRVRPAVAVDSPKALVNVLEKNGVRYLALVNDNRAYGERIGKYRAILEKLLPQTVTVTLDAWSGPLYPYDLIERKPLPVKRTGNACSFRVGLTELGGKLVALYPVRPAAVEISIPRAVRRGAECPLWVTFADASGKALPGLQPLRLTVTDAAGRPTEYSGYYCAENGKLLLALAPALNDQPGSWNVTAEDLTTGLTTQRGFELR